MSVQVTSAACHRANFLPGVFVTIKPGIHSAPDTTVNMANRDQLLAMFSSLLQSAYIHTYIPPTSLILKPVLAHNQHCQHYITFFLFKLS